MGILINPSNFERELFDKLALKHGKDSKTLNYGTQKSNDIRTIKSAEIISDMLRHKCRDFHAVVLDIGCGFGDLFTQLNKINCFVQYLGVDISDEVLKLVPNEIKNNERTQFFHGDWFIRNPKEVPKLFDGHKFTNIQSEIVCSIGALNYDHDFESVKNKIELMFDNSLIGTVFTLSSALQPSDERGTVAYWDPISVFESMFRLTPYVRIDHDYLRREFMVTLLKEQYIP